MVIDARILLYSQNTLLSSIAVPSNKIPATVIDIIVLELNISHYLIQINK